MGSGSRDNECVAYSKSIDGAREKEGERLSFYSIDGGIRAARLQRAEKPKSCIALIDPQPRTRTLISHLLVSGSSANRRSEDFTVWPVSSLQEFVSTSSTATEQTALILLNVGASCSLTERARMDYGRLRDAFPGIPIVVLSDCASPKHILRILRSGARGYVPSASPTSMLIQVIRLVLAGGTFIPPGILAGNMDGADQSLAPLENGELSAEFTPRQAEVFELLRQGKSNKVIAYELRMQESTVKVHVRQIMRKLKAINRTHAVFLVNRMVQSGLD